jgi:hypothetical protein
MGKIVPIRDSKALAQAIVEVLENRKRYVKPKNSITKEFDINKIVLFYEKLMSITYES